MSAWLGLPLLVLLLALEGFFSGSEIALVSVDKVRVRTASAANPSLRLLARFLAEPEQVLTTTLIGTNLCVVTSTTLIAVMLRGAGTEESQLELWTVLLGSPAILLFGELLPKSIFQRFADRIAPVVIHPLTWLSWLVFPAVAFVRSITQALMKLLGTEEIGALAVSRDELRLLLGRQGGPLEDEARGMINRVLDFPEVTVKEVMRPLIDIEAVEQGQTVRDAVALFVETGYSRLPVYRERIDDIVAVLHARDVLDVDDLERPVDGLMRPVPYVPPNQKGELLLEQLQRSRQAMAIVVDEYGGAEGLVTLEDILEEIVGEIEDEHDDPAPDLRRRGERDYLVPARLELDRLEEELGLTVPDGDYETLGGLLLQHFGRIPVPGDELEVEGATLRVEEASSRVVEEVRVLLDEEPDAPG